MDEFEVGDSSSSDKPKPPLRNPPWKRSVAELVGRLPSKYRHENSSLVLQSYAEIGAFPHRYHIDQSICRTYENRLNNTRRPSFHLRPEGISGLEFNSEGKHVASVTKSGCLTVHDFETLFCLSTGTSACLEEDEDKHLLHLATDQQLDVVRWNPSNQNEVACTSRQINGVLIYDIGSASGMPVQVLRKRLGVTVHGREVVRGLSDIAFKSTDEPRLLAADMNGVIHMWDRRTSNLPCLQLATDTYGTLNSIQLGLENQNVLGAGEHAIIYTWDFRGGRSSSAFRRHGEVYHPPLTSVPLAPIFSEGIGTLKEQSNISKRQIHSIDLDPSCPYNLAFLLDDGWSGVLNINTSNVTHVHHPPPCWWNLESMDLQYNFTHRRRPAWLPTSSIYAVGSSTSVFGIGLLDFYPSPNSACHVDAYVQMQKERKQDLRNRFISLSESVAVCAAHPLNGTIIAGTKKSSLLVVSQKHKSYHIEDSDTSYDAVYL